MMRVVYFPILLPAAASFSPTDYPKLLALPLLRDEELVLLDEVEALEIYAGAALEL